MIPVFKKNTFLILFIVDLILGLIFYWGAQQTGKDTTFASIIIVASACGLAWLYIRKKQKEKKAQEPDTQKTYGKKKKKKKRR